MSKTVESRRDFLKSTTAALGAATAGGLAVSRSAHAAGSDVLKIGLIGCGGRGTGAAANAMDADKNTKLVAMADAFADKVEGSLERLKKIKPDQVAVDADHCFAGFDAYKKLLASDVDVIVHGTTPHFRPEHLKACVDAGKHIFCEKPVAVDAPGVHAILDACEAAKKKNLSIVSGLCWRYHQGIQETIGRVRDGAVGDVVAIQTTYNCGAPWSRNKDRQPEWTEMEYQMRNWYPFTWLSGDHNVEQHIHSLDKAAWILGDEPPERAWGVGGRQVRSEEAIGNIFDHHAVVYEYANGVRVFSQCRRQTGCYNDVSDHVLGSKGTCNVIKFRIEGQNPWRYKGPKINMYVAEHEALFKAIRSGKPINNGLYMARSTMLAILGRMVTYTGKAITWDEAMNSKENLSPKEYTWDATPPVMPNADGSYPLAMPGITKFV